MKDHEHEYVILVDWPGRNFEEMTFQVRAPNIAKAAKDVLKSLKTHLGGGIDNQVELTFYREISSMDVKEAKLWAKTNG
jgi:hypothetical protein